MHQIGLLYSISDKKWKQVKALICRHTENSLQVLNIFHDINVTPIHVC